MSKLSGAARRNRDNRGHVIEEARMRLEEGMGTVLCSCREDITRPISTIYGEDPFEPLHAAVEEHRCKAGAGPSIPVRDRTGARFDRAIA